MVIFGEVFDDVDSGEIKISVTFQALDGEKELMKSIRISRGKAFDAESREIAMNELIGKICPKSLYNRREGKNNLVIAINDLKASSFSSGPEVYVHPCTDANLDLQVGGVLSKDMLARFSIVSPASGLFSVDRLYIKVHGYAKSELRDEYDDGSSAGIGVVNAYTIHISSEFSEYDLIPLQPFNRLSNWQYRGNDFDEFIVQFEGEPYTLFVISFELKARDLKKAKKIEKSSDLYKLIRVVNGNAGGALNLERWYIPEKLVPPKKRKYVSGIDIGQYQLLTVDLSRNRSYLFDLKKNIIRTMLPELVNTAKAHAGNLVFEYNIKVIKDYLK